MGTAQNDRHGTHEKVVVAAKQYLTELDRERIRDRVFIDSFLNDLLALSDSR